MEHPVINLFFCASSFYFKPRVRSMKPITKWICDDP